MDTRALVACPELLVRKSVVSGIELATLWSPESNQHLWSPGQCCMLCSVTLYLLCMDYGKEVKRPCCSYNELKSLKTRPPGQRKSRLLYTQIFKYDQLFGFSCSSPRIYFLMILLCKYTRLVPRGVINIIIFINPFTTSVSL